MKTILGLARLARPANLPTAAADILAGVAIASFFGTMDLDILSGTASSKILGLLLASVCLYAGGVVLNDVFDYELDQKERPERPIPSGVVPLGLARSFGGFLLVLGVLVGFWVGSLSGLVALALALLILLYDGVAKIHGFWGPLVMGLCRGANLLLGLSVGGYLEPQWFLMALVPVAFIFAITLISRGEVHGNNKSHIVWAAVLYAVVILCLAVFIGTHSENWVRALPFLLGFAIMVFRPLFRAYGANTPENIKKAVIAGVLSLVVLDAAWAAGYSGLALALIILCLLPMSWLLSKLFAVT